MYDTQGCIYVRQGHRVQFQIRYSYWKQTGSVQWLQASAVKGLNSNPSSSCFGCISLDGSLYGAISLWEYLKSVHGKCVFWKKKKNYVWVSTFFLLKQTHFIIFIFPGTLWSARVQAKGSQVLPCKCEEFWHPWATGDHTYLTVCLWEDTLRPCYWTTQKQPWSSTWWHEVVQASGSNGSFHIFATLCYRIKT